MKRARIIILIFLVAGAFYLRSLASWRPQKLFVGSARISQLAFSSNGQMLLVGQNYFERVPPRLMALDATHGFVARWSYEGGNDFIKPHFVLGDSQVLVCEEGLRSPKILDANTGRLRLKLGSCEATVISTDGKWIASSDYDCLYLESTEERKGNGQRVTGGIKILAMSGETMSSAFAFSPDSRTLVVQVTEFNSSRLDFYETESGKRTQSWPDWNSRVFGQSIQWSRNGRYLLSTWFFPTRPLGIQTSWSLWEVSHGHKLATTTFPFSERVPNFEVENQGRVLSYWTNNQVLLSEPTLHASVSKPQLELPGETITSATLSPDGSQMVAGTASGRVYSQRLK